MEAAGRRESGVVVATGWPPWHITRTILAERKYGQPFDGGERIRLIGVDTPGTVHPQKPVAYFQRPGRALMPGLRARASATRAVAASRPSVPVFTTRS